MATGAILTRKRIISQHVCSSVRSIQSFQGLGHGYSSSAYSSFGYYHHNMKERDENLVTNGGLLPHPPKQSTTSPRPYEFTVTGGDKVRSEMLLTMGMGFRSLSIHSTSAATAKKPESGNDDEEKETMAAKRRKEASPEECAQAVEGLGSIKAKPKAKQLTDSQKVAKSILQRARTIIVGIGPALRAIASMSSIKDDDRLIQSEGVESLLEAELHEDCRERGMLDLHSVEDMRQQIDPYNGMALRRARTASSALFGRFLQYPPIRLSIVHNSNAYRQFSTGMTVADNQTLLENMKRELLHLDVTSQIGSCMPLAAMRIGTMIHNIELNPGQGGKLVRAAGTCAKILKEPTSRYCLVKLPSGDEKWIDSRCRATVGTVSNPSHGARKLRKAGQSRWLGRRPVVRGVAMNPIDHPHGGGEGKSKSSGSHGRCSMTPWGKPCKGGYKTARPKRKKSGPPMRS